MPRRPGWLRQSLFGALALALVGTVAPAPAWAGFADGVKAYEAGDYKGAFDAWLPLAEGGDLAAMRNIGHLYRWGQGRSEEHTSELQSLMRISYAVFCLHKKNK